MNDKKYKAIIKSYSVTDGTIIERTSKSRIEFENIGTTNAMINNIVPLPIGRRRRYHERPDVRIDSDFEIVFTDGQDIGNNVLVTETYYEEI